MTDDDLDADPEVVTLEGVYRRVRRMENILGALVETKNGRIVRRPPRIDWKTIVTLMISFVAAMSPIVVALIVTHATGK